MTMREEQDEYLSAASAAHHLGITTELLFQFTKRSFATASGLRSLKAVDQDGETRFRRSELDEFDALLAGPWPETSGRRPPVPKAIVDHLRAESQNQCARCGSGVGVDTAHIRSWAESRSHHPHNLIRICSGCHREHDAQNSLSTEQLSALKNELIARTRSRLIDRIAPSSPLSRIPRSVLGFHGRGSELSRLLDALRSGKSILITGAGGIGKTELLLQALCHFDTRRTIFWLDVEQFRTASDVLAALRTALGSNGAACSADELPSRLDTTSACIVLDGIENGALEDLDQLEDDMAALHAATRQTQFVSTSQISLHRMPAEVRLRIGKLDAEASRALLLQSCAEPELVASGDLGPLLDFCEGHALTLRLASALVDHFGSASTALRAIDRSGASAVRLPRRHRHSRKTSLERCLATAYSALPPASRQLLVALALAPAGMFSHYLDEEWVGIADTGEAAAMLRGWHLVERHQIEGDISRTYVLSPIRRFAIDHAGQEDPQTLDDLIERLVQGWALQVAVLELNYNAPEATPYVLARYRDELPNLLQPLELARRKGVSPRLVESAVAIARALMRYFFVSRLPEQGTRVMHAAAGLAMGAGQLKMASGVAMQLISLALRADDEDLVDAGLDLADRIEGMTDNKEILADAALCRAMASRDRGALVEAEHHARRAFELYRECLRTLLKETAGKSEGEEDPSFAVDELHNDIVQALGMLGFALEGQNKYAEALTVYRHALQHERGASIAVNRGQTLHQIGNCESNLSNHRVASEHYLEAAQVFDFVGMKEYLSNALGELGFALLDVDAPDLVDALDEELIDAGLRDLFSDTARAFDPGRALDHQQCVGAIRKLFGCIILVSLTRHGEKLGPFGVGLAQAIMTPIGEQIDEGQRDREEVFPVLMIDTAVRLGILVAQAEHSVEQTGELPEDLVGALLRIVCTSHKWAQDVMRVIDWLSAYLSRRWKFTGAGRERLRSFVDNFDPDVEDHLELSQ